MKASNVIDLSRLWLQDSVSPYRWSDSVLLGHLNGTIREALQRRPDLRLADDGTLNVVFDTLAMAGDPLALPDGDLPLGDDWMEPFAHGVAARALAQDGADIANLNFSQFHRSTFVGAL